MGYAVAFVGLVATLQGVGWIATGGTRRARAGMFLAPLGLLLFGGGLITAFVPGFLG